MYDVIIVGAGPIGSYVAGRLAGEGHAVLVLEKKSRIGESVCTGIIGRECVQEFSVDSGVILREASSASLFPPSGERLHIRREEPQACILDRSAFDIALAEDARKAGAEILLDRCVKDVTVQNDGALVSVSHQGNKEEIESKVVVIAAGFAPGLLARLGFGAFGDYTVGAQAVVEAPGLEEVEVYFGDMAPGFFAWLVPAVPPLARVGLLSRRKPGRLLRKWLEELADNNKIASTDVEIKYGAIPIKPLKRTITDRMLVVGDAAGQVKPTSGGGIYYGLLCARIAAGELHKVLVDNDLSADRLALYERRWRRKLARELKTGYWARRLFERLSYNQIDRIFRVIKAGRIDEALLNAPDLSFDWHGRTLMRLLRYQAVAGTLNILKLPFRAGRIDR